MSRHTRLLLCLAAILLLIIGVPRCIHADGIAVTDEDSTIEMPAQKAIIVWNEDRGHEDLILSVELLGSPEAAWVVPLPALPEVKVASPDWFPYLIDVTQPRVEYRDKTVYHDGACLIMTVEVEKGVELLSREEVGVYDVSILSADEPGELLDWLHDNSYSFPEEGGRVLDAYVEEGGWYFVAARVLPDESAHLSGDVQPLWLSFDTERPIYPMRLTALMKSYIHLLIFVLADHRMMWQDHEYAGIKFVEETMLSSLSAQESDTDLVDLLTHRSYFITKLNFGAFRPDMMEEDLYFERAEDDEPYREVVHRIRYVCLPATATPPLKSPTEQRSERTLENSGWLTLGLSLVLIGVLVGVGLVRLRRSQQESDEEP
jgi:hypothetical protein